MLFGSLLQRMRAIWGTADSALPSVSPAVSHYLQSAAKQHLVDIRSAQKGTVHTVIHSQNQENSSNLTPSLNDCQTITEIHQHTTQSQNHNKNQPEPSSTINDTTYPKRKKAGKSRRRPRSQPKVPNPHLDRDLFYIVQFTSCRIGHHLEYPTGTETETGTSNENSLPVLNPEDSIALAKYRDVKSRLIAGFFPSVNAKIHKELEGHYEKVIDSLARNNNTNGTADTQIKHILSLRNKLANLWIIYAHAILEVGLELYQHQQQQLLIRKHEISINEHYSKKPAKRRRNQRRASTRTEGTKLMPLLTVNDVLNHAFAILQAARECPLVGNHKHVVLSFGRLLVAGCVLGSDDYQTDTIILDAPTLQAAITDAINSCHDSMEICHGALHTKLRVVERAQAEPSIQNICKYFSNQTNNSDNTKRTRIVTACHIGEELRSVLLLPQRLRDTTKLSQAVTNDLTTARAICDEVNRLCRLREKLGKRIYTLLFPCPEERGSDGTPLAETSLLEHLIFYRTMDCGSDVPPENAKWSDVEYAPPDDDGGYVEWHW